MRDVVPLESPAPEDARSQNEDWLRDVFVLGDGLLEHFDDLW
jgi:hypothetical protein